MIDTSKRMDGPPEALKATIRRALQIAREARERGQTLREHSLELSKVSANALGVAPKAASDEDKTD